MTRPDTLSRFVAAVELALALPAPTSIYRAILANTQSVDDGLRGTAYDGDRTSGGSSTSSVERMLERKHPGQYPKPTDEAPEWEQIKGKWGARTDRARDDMLHLHRATTRAMDAIATLNAECSSAEPPDDWDDAIKCAHILHETGMMQAAIDVGRDVDSAAVRFSHAIDTVRAIRDSWMAHAPAQGLAEANYAWCRPHLRIGVNRKRVTAVCCQMCWRDIQDLQGDVLDDHGRPVPAVELQTDPANWPSEPMQQAREDGRQVLFEKERTTWLRSRGVDPLRAHQRRQGRRSA